MYSIHVCLVTWQHIINQTQIISTHQTSDPHFIKNSTNIRIVDPKNYETLTKSPVSTLGNSVNLDPSTRPFSNNVPSRNCLENQKKNKQFMNYFL